MFNVPCGPSGCYIPKDVLSDVNHESTTCNRSCTVDHLVLEIQVHDSGIDWDILPHTLYHSKCYVVLFDAKTWHYFCERCEKLSGYD